MNQAETIRRVRRATLAGLLLNILLALAKAAGGIVFSSQALVADVRAANGDDAAEIQERVFEQTHPHLRHQRFGAAARAVRA